MLKWWSRAEVKSDEILKQTQEILRICPTSKIWEEDKGNGTVTFVTNGASHRE